MEEVKIGKVYRHFKGNYYFVENVALDSENKERVVIYTAIYDRDDSQIWVRKEKMFLEEIPERPDNITGQKHRFELVEEIEKDYLKLVKKYQNKYKDKELERKVIESLLLKGYNYKSVKEYIGGIPHD